MKKWRIGKAKKKNDAQSSDLGNKKGLHGIRESTNKFAIIFVHGLGGHPFQTWTKKNCDPLPLLMKKDDSFNEYDIYSFSYKTNFLLKGHHIKDISDLLFTEIKARVHHKEIYFVTHSMGGVIVQSMLVEQVERGNYDFLNLNRGIIYLAVPFGGSNIASVASKAYALVPPLIGDQLISVQVRSLKVYSRELHELSVKWLRYVSSLNHIRQKIIYGKSDWAVGVASSHAPYISDVDSVEEDHRSICKVDYNSTVYRLLTQFFAASKQYSSPKAQKEIDTPGQKYIESIEQIILPLVYAQLDDYIPRRVINLEKSNSASWLIAPEELHGILEVIKENKLITLLGGAGTGKSTELKFLASMLSNNPCGYYPVLINLNKYTPRSLTELLNEFWSDWRNVSDDQLLLILDGLDEIESKYKKDAIRFIELFIDQHPMINILISCRKNFYQSESGDFSGTLQGFKSYVLYDLDQNDIDLYIETKLGAKLIDFKDVIHENRLQELICIPFYLIRMVKMYIKDGVLPRNKSQLYEELLSQGINNDVEHFRNTFELHEERKTLIEALESLALGMEDLGRNYISEEELCLLVNNKDIREILSHCSVWKKQVDNNGVKWQFEHNNFQEYLAARILARQDLGTIKTFLAFPPEFKKVIPSWVNTLSFLVNIIDFCDERFTQLLEWLQYNDPEMIVYFETEHVEEALRIQLFKHVFNIYKEKQIWINRDKFDLSSLARFGQSIATIDFLINEIKTDQNYTTRVNALKLIIFMKVSLPKRSEVCSILLEILMDENQQVLIRSTALATLTYLHFQADQVIEAVVNSIRHSTDDSLRTNLYTFLVNSNAVDRYVNVFLEGIKYVGINISDSESRLINEKIELEAGLEKVSSNEGIQKIVQFFNENLEKQDHHFWNDLVEAIANNAAKAFEFDSNIYLACFELYKNLNKYYWQNEAAKFVVFFDKTKTRQKAIDSLLFEKIEDRYNWDALGLLIKEEHIESIIDTYLKGELTDENMWSLQWAISWEIKDFFNKRINEVSENKFLLQDSRDYEKERKLRSIQDLNLLFSKEAFVEQIRLLYVEKQAMTKDELIKVKIQLQKKGLSYSEIVVRFLYQLAGSVSLGLDRVLHIVGTMDWDSYWINEVHKIMSSSKEIEISEKQRELIKSWCERNVENADFKSALTKNPNGSTSGNTTCINLWFFFRKLNLTFPKNILLDMISFDWIEGSEMLGIEYLEEHLDLDSMSERIWRNLTEGINIDEVLVNHIHFCMRHDIQEVLPISLSLIIDGSKSEAVRRAALHTYLKIDKELNIIISKIKDIGGFFKYEVIKSLFERGIQDHCYDQLNTLLQDETIEKDKLEATKYLIKLQDIEALKFYVSWVRQKVKEQEVINILMPLQTLKRIDALPYVIELLELTYLEGFKQNQFERIDTEVRNALVNIALQSSDNYNHVKLEVERFVKSNKHLKYVNFLYSFIEDMEARYYVTLQSGRDIGEVIIHLESIKNS
ncbi:hypothetical protein [Paenibacillus sp. OV219]|uniref:hypothetical protein n=1 Tax=Paenibacillus sp. OV219 TaxID=1884377 RepID=UPI0008B7AF0B|nr:hypothetical protein [Paenibacillus sp. OV219]SEP01329.1 hypothetical protein SAMN05518847_11451 [Paenibacillus sp. OV219]